PVSGLQSWVRDELSKLVDTNLRVDVLPVSMSNRVLVNEILVRGLSIHPGPWTHKLLLQFYLVAGEEVQQLLIKQANLQIAQRTEQGEGATTSTTAVDLTYANTLYSAKQNPQTVLEQNERRKNLLAEDEIIGRTYILFYLAGRKIKEIAVLLDIPQAEVED